MRVCVQRVRWRHGRLRDVPVGQYVREQHVCAHRRRQRLRAADLRPAQRRVRPDRQRVRQPSSRAPSCPSGQTCVYNHCESADGGACFPLTCANFPSTTCGQQSDGCGGATADCNPCTPPATCGGGGIPNQCGYPEAGACTPLTCASFPPSTCGPQADGCGGVTAFCNPCTSPAVCGGGGVAGQCGYPDAGACVPETCAQQNLGCGPAGDGCGNVIQCGPCTPPATCGGGGASSQCGLADAGACVPLTCASQHVACGPAGDGCGNLLMCGTCTGTQTCGGGGTPGQCGGGSQ